MPNKRAKTPLKPMNRQDDEKLQTRLSDLEDRAWDELARLLEDCKPIDLIRFLEFSSKLIVQSNARDEFWSMIDEIRREELATGKPKESTA